MSSLIPVDFDNMVFSLQKTGGGSIYWFNLISRAMDCGLFDLVFHDRADSGSNIQRSELEDKIKKYRILQSRLPVRIDEVTSVRVDRPCILHSSYFRTGSNNRAINVVTIYDFICEYYFTGLVKYFQLNQMKKAVKNADAIICISNSTKDDLLKIIPESINKTMTVIPLGFDSDRYRYHEAVREKKVVFVGNRSASYKNFNLAVESVALCSDVVLQIVGAPLSVAESEYLDKKLPGRYVAYTYPDSAEVARLYNSSAALLYLSEYEGFGIPVLEAMSSGCPVIALNKSSIPEVAGNSAILLNEFSPSLVAERIEGLCSFDSCFDSIVMSGLERSRHFSWDLMADSTFDFYQSLL